MSIDCSRLFGSPELIWPTSPWTWGWEEFIALAMEGRAAEPELRVCFLEVTGLAFACPHSAGGLAHKAAKGQQEQPAPASKSAQLSFSADTESLAQGVCTSGYQKEPLN